MKGDLTDLDEHHACPICTEEFNLNEVFITLPCSHIFHSECLTTWLKMVR